MSLRKIGRYKRRERERRRRNTYREREREGEEEIEKRAKYNNTVVVFLLA
jgi:hypothetical protein